MSWSSRSTNGRRALSASASPPRHCSNRRVKPPSDCVMGPHSMQFRFRFKAAWFVPVSHREGGIWFRRVGGYAPAIPSRVVGPGRGLARLTRAVWAPGVAQRARFLVSRTPKSAEGDPYAPVNAAEVRRVSHWAPAIAARGPGARVVQVQEPHSAEPTKLSARGLREDKIVPIETPQFKIPDDSPPLLKNLRVTARWCP
jgi:hypothetical protein